MSVLVIAEHTHAQLSTATLPAITAAAQLGPVHVLVAGHQAAHAAAEAAMVQGVEKVLHADHEAYNWPLAENIAPLVQAIATHYTHILAPSTTTGKDILPRLAALLDVGQISDVLSIISEDTFTRPVYAGNAIATVQSKDAIKLLTVRTTAFDKAASASASASIEMLAPATISNQATFVSVTESKSERPELTSARRIVSGGRGLGSKENFALIEKIADKLGAGIGASRAAVDAGYVPNDYQVGQTGKVVAPELYIAVGISGAIQHLAGMKDSKVIVAINKDENAPIFEIADYGLVGDLFTLLPELEKAL